MADEAGRFAWTLSRRGIDGPRAILVLLQQVDGSDPTGFTPDPERPGWVSGAGGLCPISTGAALLDRSDRLPSLFPLRLVNVMSPALLLAAADLLTADRIAAMQVEWDGIHHFPRTGVGPGAADGSLFRYAAKKVTLDFGERQSRLPLPAVGRQFVDPVTWDALERYAGRTYAPATELSRIRGAG